MIGRWRSLVLAGVAGVGLWSGLADSAQAQVYTYDAFRFPVYQDRTINRFWYYPYYYFPHNYWPGMSPHWPEAPGKPYMRPPAYMAFPPFKEPYFRYEYWNPQTYHRGFHFMLDIF
jgi:hypothetical protein